MKNDKDTFDSYKRIKIQEQWLRKDSLRFKILIMIAALATDNRAFRGSMKEICDFLEVQYATKNTDRIKEAIEQLKNEGLIDVYNYAKIWTLTLNHKYNSGRIAHLLRSELNSIKSYKTENRADSVSWEKILKILAFLLLYKNREATPLTYDLMARNLNMSQDTVRRAIKALCNINFETGLTIEREKKWLMLEKENEFEENEFILLGQIYHIYYDFTKNDNKKI